MIDIPRIKYYMHMKNETQGTLAKAVGTSATSITSYLTNKVEPKLGIARQICECLNIPEEERGKIFLQ